MIYLDTSVVVALLTREEHSPVALKWLEQCREPLISSDWLITETHSALGIKQRHHGLSVEARQAAGEQFERLLQGGVELRSLDRGRFRQAAGHRSVRSTGNEPRNPPPAGAAPRVAGPCSGSWRTWRHTITGWSRKHLRL
ncbi:MAG: type II toxin-antitoxin system VapC family toxin [Cyanobium sp.]